MKLTIKSLQLKNFKGVKEGTYNFDGQACLVFGANATGKTTIFDGLWWLLFNKDSLGNENFSLRPLDEKGNLINYIEISVSAVLDIDGKELKLSKIQKQKWVKKRDSAETLFQGNINLYEINGFPKSEKDYKEAVFNIINENAFKMLTSPTYFSALPWKEQRELLISLVDDDSDYDLASRKPEFGELLEDISNASTLGDIQKKYQKALSEWKKKQIELPVRIDEAAKQKIDVDFAELELYKNSIIEDITKLNSSKDDMSAATEQQRNISDEIYRLNSVLEDMRKVSDREYFNARNKIIEKINNNKTLESEILRDMAIKKSEILKLTEEINHYIQMIETYRHKYKHAQSAKIDENSLVCDMCGRSYPDDKISEIRADFAVRNAALISNITKKGNETKDNLKKSRIQLSALEDELKTSEGNLDCVREKLAVYEQELNGLQRPQISESEEYLNIQNQISELEMQLKLFENKTNLKESTNNQITTLQDELLKVENQLAAAERNAQIDTRIAELSEELRDVTQNIALQEKMLYLLEQFIKYKMRIISDLINSKFENVNFKLFDYQINGGIKECCEVTVNGVPYGSLNNGHKIISGINIIKTFQSLYNTSIPIFIDNAESLNDFNIPDVESQLILMKVSDDKKIMISKKEG